MSLLSQFQHDRNTRDLSELLEQLGPWDQATLGLFLVVLALLSWRMRLMSRNPLD